ncbi:MAG: viroplasmin family protein [Paludibacter sp.]
MDVGTTGIYTSWSECNTQFSSIYSWVY